MAWKTSCQRFRWKFCKAHVCDGNYAKLNVWDGKNPNYSDLPGGLHFPIVRRQPLHWPPLWAAVSDLKLLIHGDNRKHQGVDHWIWCCCIGSIQQHHEPLLPPWIWQELGWRGEERKGTREGGERRHSGSHETGRQRWDVKLGLPQAAGVG